MSKESSIRPAFDLGIKHVKTYPSHPNSQIVIFRNGVQQEIFLNCKIPSTAPRVPVSASPALPVAPPVQQERHAKARLEGKDRADVVVHRIDEYYARLENYFQMRAHQSILKPDQQEKLQRFGERTKAYMERFLHGAFLHPKQVESIAEMHRDAYVRFGETLESALLRPFSEVHSYFNPFSKGLPIGYQHLAPHARAFWGSVLMARENSIDDRYFKRFDGVLANMFGGNPAASIELDELYRRLYLGISYHHWNPPSELYRPLVDFTKPAVRDLQKLFP